MISFFEETYMLMNFLNNPILEKLENLKWQFHLVGSRFLGTDTKESDIDFIVQLPKNIEEFIELVNELANLGFHEVGMRLIDDNNLEEYLKARDLDTLGNSYYQIPVTPKNQRTVERYSDFNTHSIFKHQSEKIDIVIKYDVECHLAINKLFKAFNFGSRLAKLKGNGQNFEITKFFNLLIALYYKEATFKLPVPSPKDLTKDKNCDSAIKFSLSDESSTDELF